MAIRLDTRSGDFAQKFRAFLDSKREAAADVEAVVRDIVGAVAEGGHCRGVGNDINVLR